jgi:hypothetical protein
MKITTQGPDPQEFTPIDVVIRVETQKELDALKSLSSQNTRNFKDDAIDDDEKEDIDNFLDSLYWALEDC